MTLTRHSLLLVVFMVSGRMFGQVAPPCPFPSPPAAEECWATCVYCDLQQGYWGTNNGTPSTGNTICAQIAIHNDQYLGFVAGTETIVFEVISNNCQNGDGLQVAVFEDCGAPDALICNPGSAGTAGFPLSLPYTNYAPGHVYYLMIDGWSGDVCDYEIFVSQGSVWPISPSLPGPISGQGVVCQGGAFEYSVPEVTGASYYQWTAPPGSDINGTGLNSLWLPAPGSSSVTISFGPNSGNVCVKVSNACGTETPQACKPVTVGPNIITQLPYEEVYFEELPYTWTEEPFTILTSPGVYNLTSFPYYSYAGCDSVIKQTVRLFPPMASGVVFYDVDGNGVYGFPDQPVENAMLINGPAGDTIFTDADGVYRFFNVTDTVHLEPPYVGATFSPAGWPVDWFFQSAGYDFAVAPPPFPTGYDLSVDLTNLTVFRQGFNTSMVLTVNNYLATTTPFASTCIVLPYFIDFVSSNPAPDYISGDTICWSVGALSGNGQFTIKMQVKTALGTPNNKQVSIPVWVIPENDDQFPDNNFYVLATETDGSWDPNDKSVRPEFVTPGMLSGGEYFEYTIRFQNTGTHPADFVRIIDTLSAQLDAESFRFIASSHPCTWSVSPGGVVDVFFENIQLPDSNANEPESHGFVKFAVKPEAGLSLGDQVQNFCDIYFDFNDPVRTNTVGTQVVYFIPGDGFPDVADALKARPNPANFLQEFTWLTPTPEHGVFRYIDILGIPRVTMPVEPGWKSISVDVSQVPNGTYLAVLESGGLVLHKLVIVQHGIGVGF